MFSKTWSLELREHLNCDQLVIAPQRETGSTAYAKCKLNEQSKIYSFCCPLYSCALKFMYN